MLTTALIAVAVVAGLAGAWSPCGLSMVDTLAPDACGGRRRTSVIGAVAFAIGALAGGVVTFGGLALLGERLGAGGGAAAAVAVAVLMVAAAGDAAGRRIVPQVRRQVPESWRRLLPVPVAAGLYGVLLGLGFTTFVLSFATWALAAACLAVGAPATGVAIGIAFGIGRAVPVAVLAPMQDRGWAIAVAEAMGERPQVLRGLRAAAAAGLAVAAAVLVVAPPEARAGETARSAAAATFAFNATDPSASGGLVAWQGADAGRLRRADGSVVTVPGGHPAVAEGLLAYVTGDQIVLADAATLVPLAAYAAPGADALGLSTQALAYRARGDDGLDRIYAYDLAQPATQPPAVAGTARRGGSLGRPEVEGLRVIYASQARSVSRILERDLVSGAFRTLRRATRALLLAPSVDGGRLLHVRSTSSRQRVLIGPDAPGGGDRAIYSTTPTGRRDSGHEPGKSNHTAGYGKGGRPKKSPRPKPGVTVTVWNTALSGAEAYFTRLRHRRGGAVTSRILRVGL